MSYAAKSIVLPLWDGMLDPGPLSLQTSPAFNDIDADSPFLNRGVIWEAKPLYTQIAFAITVSGSYSETVVVGTRTTETVESYSYSNTVTLTRQSISELLASKTIEQNGLGNQTVLRDIGPLRVARSGSRENADAGKAVFSLYDARTRIYEVEDIFAIGGTSEEQFSVCDPDYQSMAIGGITDTPLVDLSAEVVGTQTVTVTVEQPPPDPPDITVTESDIEMDLAIQWIRPVLSTPVLNQWKTHDILRPSASMDFSSGETPVAPEISDWDIDISAWDTLDWHDWINSPDHPFTWSETSNGVTVQVVATIS